MPNRWDIFLNIQLDHSSANRRLNYILWIEDIINTTIILPGTSNAVAEENSIIGIDMSVSNSYESALFSDKLYSGTGASAIYPLLGCRTKSDWRFVATGKYRIYLPNRCQLNSQQNLTICHSDMLSPISVITLCKTKFCWRRQIQVDQYCHCLFPSFVISSKLLLQLCRRAENNI